MSIRITVHTFTYFFYTIQMEMPHLASTIHPTAVVYPGASIGAGCEIGPYVVIESSASIGKNCKIGPHVHILGKTIIGNSCHIRAGAVLGGEPQDDNYNQEKTRVEIGNSCQIHEHVTIHRGTTTQLTKVGDHVRLMSGAHVGHDAEIGNHAILVNNASVGGHAKIGERVILSGQSAVHQFVQIGRLTMVAGACMVTRDVPPFSIVTGAHPMKWRGINKIGLQRQGFTSEERDAIREALRTLFNNKTNIEEMKNSSFSSVREIADFVNNTTRGLPKS